MPGRDRGRGGSFDLEAAWPVIAARLDRVLIARKVPSWQRDDIVQETALRLVQMRGSLDPARSIEGLAVTVALNLLRDDYRAARRASPGLVPERAAPDDVESAVLAKLEVGKVGRALRRLSSPQRDAILTHLQEEPAGATRSAYRMLRMRARRRLEGLIDRAEIFVFASRTRLGRMAPLSEPAPHHPVSWPGDSPVGSAVVLGVAALLARGPLGGDVAPAAGAAFGHSPPPPVALQSADAARVLRAEEILRAARSARSKSSPSDAAARRDSSPAARRDVEPRADVSLEVAGTSAEVEDGSGGGESRARVEHGKTFVEIKP